jgi:hypothetical protein
MIVVADTGPLNYLIRTGYISLLPELFGRVLDPKAVITELLHPQAPPEIRAVADALPDWLERVEVRHIAAGLPAALGEGEREAISLALELHADALLIDDLAGRRSAESLHIPARGTLAILLQASLRGRLHFPTAFQQLTQLGFRVSPALQDALFAEYNKGQLG